MTTKVFISYAFQDKQFAEIAKKTLGARGYFPKDTVVFDAQDVSVGENVRERLKAEMAASSSVVLVMSDTAESSHWVNYEAGLADALGKKILIVGKKGSRNTQLPAHLSNYQRVDLEGVG